MHTESLVRIIHDPEEVAQARYDAAVRFIGSTRAVPGWELSDEAIRRWWGIDPPGPAQVTPRPRGVVSRISHHPERVYEVNEHGDYMEVDE